MTPTEQAYSEIESKFRDCCVDGKVAVDEFLAHPKKDIRRGMSLIIRPSAEISERIIAMQGRLGPLLGDQYFYPAGDLHMTVYSAIPVGASASFHALDLPAYASAVKRTVVRSSAPFTLRFAGISASDQAILVKGYPCDDQLRRLQDDILEEFQAMGFEFGAKRRFRNESAHITFARFARQVPNLPALRQALSDLQDFEFGKMTARELQLFENDWYLRPNSLKEFGRFTLG